MKEWTCRSVKQDGEPRHRSIQSPPTWAVPPRTESVTKRENMYQHLELGWPSPEGYLRASVCVNVCRYQNPILVFIFKHFLECCCSRNWDDTLDSEHVTVSFLLQGEDCCPRRSSGHHAVHLTVLGHTWSYCSLYWCELGCTHPRNGAKWSAIQERRAHPTASDCRHSSSSFSPPLSSCTAAPASWLFLKHQAHCCLRHRHPCWKLHSPNAHGVKSSLCSGLFSKVISSARPAQAARANISVHHLKCYIILFLIFLYTLFFTLSDNHWKKKNKKNYECLCIYLFHSDRYCMIVGIFLLYSCYIKMPCT